MSQTNTTPLLAAQPLSSSSDTTEEVSSSCFTRFRQSPNSVLVVVSFALFVDLFIYAVIIPVLPLFVRDKLGASSSATGLLFACYAGGLLVFTPLFAVLSDKYDTRRAPMLGGLACLAASTVLFGMSRNMGELMVARFAQGASAAASNTIGLAMLADIFPPSELGTQMGVVLAINGLGALIGPPVGGALYEHVSFLSIFLLTGSLAFLDLILRIVCIDEQWMRDQRDRIKASENEKREKQRLEEAETERQHQKSLDHSQDASVGELSMQSPVDSLSAPPAITTTTSASEESTDSAPALFKSISFDPSSHILPMTIPHRLHAVEQAPLNMWGMVKIPTLMVTQIGVITLSIIFTGIEPLMSLHFNDSFGSSSDAIGYAYFAIAIPYMVSGVGVGELLEKGYEPKLLVASGFAVATVALALFDTPNNLYVELAPMIGFGIGLGFAMTPPLGEIAEYLTKTGNQNSFGQGYALFNISFSFGTFIGPVLTGFLNQHLGFGVTMWVLTGLAAITSLIEIGYVYCDRRMKAQLKQAHKGIQVAHEEP